MHKLGLHALPLIALTLAATALADPAAAVVDPTAGWKQERVTYKVHWPYDVPQDTRFSLKDGVFHLWVFVNDKPLRPGNTTKPRSELRFPDYTRGAQQYEADLLVPSGTAGTCVMQIHTGDEQSPRFGSTTFMIFVEPEDGGSLHYYSKDELARDIDNRWFHLNVIHDMRTGVITAYLDHREVYRKHDQHAGDYYMKTGVYGQRGQTRKTEVFIKNLRLWSQ